MRPNRSSGISAAMSGGNRAPTRACQPRSASRSRIVAAQAQCAQVLREVDHFVGLYAGVDEQHPGWALHDNRIALDERTLVDQYTLCDLPQHVAPSVCGMQPL